MFFYQKGNIHEVALLNQKTSLGTHVLVDFYNCNTKSLNDVQFVRESLLEAARIAEAAIVTENFHIFSPHGISGVVIIQESHITIHTWPEYGYAAVDLFTCGSNLKLKNAMLFLKERFQSTTMEFNNIMRGVIKAGKALKN